VSARGFEPVPDPLPVLEAGAVHVYAARLDAATAAALASSLSADERTRAERFHFERDRTRFGAARGLLRSLLGRSLGLPPSELRFTYGRRGKPSLPNAGELRFNVSHSGGRGLFALTRVGEVGVDVEQERPLQDLEQIVARYFSARESDALLALPEAERGPAFFRCWTRKEAFIKATGDGLSRPLDAFDVAFGRDEPARLLRVAGEPEAPGRFRLEALDAGPGFAAALAVAGPPDRIACWSLDLSEEESDGTRREGRHDAVQGRPEPRGAVLDLAGGA
jgi:4'-phosphopantetheinyl transferase